MKTHQGKKWSRRGKMGEKMQKKKKKLAEDEGRKSMFGSGVE